MCVRWDGSFSDSFHVSNGVQQGGVLTHSHASSTCSAHIYFCGQLLPFLDTVSHLGHLLCYNLNDTEDVNSNVVRSANCLLATFPRVGPFILTCVFFNPTVCLFMSLASGQSHALLFRTLKLPSIRLFIHYKTKKCIIAVCYCACMCKRHF